MTRIRKPVASGDHGVNDRSVHTSSSRRQLVTTEPTVTLEAAGQATRLVAMAEDAVDGLAVVFDLAAFYRHREAQNSARCRGDSPPHPPAPVSKLLTGFAATLREKTVAIGALLDSEEQTRLTKLSRGLMTALEAGDPDVVQALGQLLPADPVVIALWIRCNLPVLEIRFAS